MIAASYSMIKKKKTTLASENQKINYPLILIQGAFVGVLTGLVGAGGGFLIIPALVIFSKLSMKEAIGTSLAIISVNSLIGFLSEISNPEINWRFLLSIAGLAIFGILIGVALSKKIEGPKLKPAFGWFVLVMGIYILSKELLF
jgi:hypothetical protein